MEVLCSKLSFLVYGSLAHLHFLDQVPQLSHLTDLLLRPLHAFLGQKIDLFLKLMCLNLQVPFGLFIDRVLAYFVILVLRILKDEILQVRLTVLHFLNFSLLVQHALFFSHESCLVLRDELFLLFEVLLELAFFEDAFDEGFGLDVDFGVLFCPFEDGREVCVAEDRKDRFDV